MSGLIGMKEEFEAEDFCTVVFDEFFFTCINIDNVVSVSNKDLVS